MQVISEKINNFNYAPGTATYGAEGLPGAQGNDGNCIFFTSYNIIGGEDLQAFKQCMRENRLPIRSGTVIPRKFKNGDYFFDRLGNILVLTDIDQLMSFPALSNNYNTYFNFVGKIRPAQTQDNIFTKTENSSRISLNSQYAGVDINNSDMDIDNSNDNTNYALRIISGDITGDNVEVLHGTAYYNYNKMSDIKFYYDTVNNIWHIDSEIPIVIDSEVSVNNDAAENISLDNYSSVITTNTPITVFYNLAKEITWSYKDGYYIVFNNNKLPEQIKNDTRIKIVTSSGQVLIKTFQNISDRFSFQTNTIQTISLIYNIEVYLNRVTLKTSNEVVSGVVKIN